MLTDFAIRPIDEWIRRVAPAVAVTCVACVAAPAHAAQLQLEDDCSFVVDVPGIFSTSHLNYSARSGTIFTSDQDGKFCGPVTATTPLGDTTQNECFVVTNGQLISGAWSNKISSSTCTLSDASKIDVVFDESLSTRYGGTGPSTLRGQAFLRTVGGDVKTCAGRDVLLVPASAYFDELIRKVGSGVNVEADRRALALIRKSICDAQGNFQFAQLPVGQWYVIAKVTWGVPHTEERKKRTDPLTALIFGAHRAPSVDEQGGTLLQSVDLQPGDNQALLTDRDLR